MERCGVTYIQTEKVMYLFELQIQTLKAIPIMNIKVILAYSRFTKYEIPIKYLVYVLNFKFPPILIVIFESLVNEIQLWKVISMQQWPVQLSENKM